MPILFDNIKPPIPFRTIQTDDFSAWNGSLTSEEFVKLQRAVARLVGSRSTNSKIPTTDNNYCDRVSSESNKKTSVPKNPQAVIPNKPTVNNPVPNTTIHKVRKFAPVVLVSLMVIGGLGVGFFQFQNDGWEKDDAVHTQSTPGNTQPNPKKKIIEPEMINIPAGQYRMGSDSADSDERPVHDVTIKAFKLGRNEVTFDEYDQYAESAGKPKPNDQGWGRGKRPVINVSWEDASAYATWLSEQTVKSYRLPTEAEWEYAARAGNNGDYYWGQGLSKNYAWFSENSQDKTQPVGQKQPNAFGLYDVSGNAWEWVQDCWHENYNNAHKDGSAWLEAKGGECSRRVLRGGSWFVGARNLRSAYRFKYGANYRLYDGGFRLAQD